MAKRATSTRGDKLHRQNVSFFNRLGRFFLIKKSFSNKDGLFRKKFKELVGSLIVTAKNAYLLCYLTLFGTFEVIKSGKLWAKGEPSFFAVPLNIYGFSGLLDGDRDSSYFFLVFFSYDKITFTTG